MKKNPALAISSGDCTRYLGHMLNESALVDRMAYFGYFGFSIQTPIDKESNCGELPFPLLVGSSCERFLLTPKFDLGLFCVIRIKLWVSLLDKLLEGSAFALFPPFVLLTNLP